MNLPEQFVEFLNSQKKKPSKATVKNYKADVLQFIRWFEKHSKKNFEPTEITPQIIELYKSSSSEETEHQLSPRSLKRHLSSLKKFFHFLKIEGVASMNPFDNNQQSTINNQQSDPWHLRDFKNYLYVYNASNLTIKNYLMDVKQFMQWAEQVTAVDKEWQASERNIFSKLDWKLIDEYKTRLIGEHFSPLTINRKLSSLRKYMAWAKEQGFVKKDTQPKIQPVAPQVRYIPVAAVQPKSEPEPEPEPKPEPAAETPKSYSKIPPLRLGQKIVTAGDFFFDLIFIEPLALLFKGVQYGVWKLRGKPVFKTSQKLAKTPTQVYNVKKEFYAQVSTQNMSFGQKTLHHLRFTRPKWYIKYHSYAFVHYLHFGALIILMFILGFYIFQNLRISTPSQLTQIVAGDSTKRTLVFQGKLADSKNNPITGPSLAQFTIYDKDKSGKALWTETIDINPNAQGSFSVILGNKNPLYQDLFVKNYTLWLGIAINNDPELTPRQQLANVALSENAQTLDGLLPITQSKTGSKNVVLALDSSGNLTIGGEASSTFQAIGGEFTLSGNVLTLTTVAGTNSDIILSPDGLGKIDIRKPIFNSSNSSTIPGAAGAVELVDNLFILASSSAQSALIINQTDIGPLFSASSSGIAKFTVDGLGNTTIAGDLILAGSRISASGLTDANLGNSSLEVGAISTTGNFSQTGSSTFSTGTGSVTLNGDVSLGTSSANTITFKGRVAQDSSLIPKSPTGTNDLGAASFPWDTLYANYVKPGGTDGQQGWWTRSNSVVFPTTTTDGIIIGSNILSTSKFSVVGSSGNTSVGGTLGVTGATTLSSTLGVTGNTTLTGDLAVNGGDITTSATTFNLVNATATTLNIGGAATTVSLGAATGTTTVNNALTVTGATTLSSTLGVTGAATFSSTITSSGLITANGGVTVASGQSLTLAGLTSNGGVIYTNGSGVVAQATAGTSTQVLHGGTSPSFSAVSLTADVSGVLPIANGGTNKALTLAAGAVAYSDADSFELTAVGSSNQCLISNGSSAPSWASCSSGLSNDVLWSQSSGALYPNNATVDLLIGGTATSSAKFAFLNVNTGTPVASISANTANNATYLTGDGTIATTNRGTLTIGNSATYNTTGNVLINPNGTGKVGIGTGTTAPGAKFHIKQAADSFGDSIRLEASGATNTWDFLMGGDAKLYFGYNSATQFLVDTSGNLSLGNIAAASRIGLEGTGVTKGITFGDGAASPVTLYRNANDELKTDDSLTVAAQADIEGYAAIGNGSALSADNTLILNRNFTASLGSSPSILSIPSQTITENSSTGTHALISALSITAPTITAGTHAVTNTASLYVSAAMSATVTGSNYALWVDAGTSAFGGSIVPDTNDGAALGTTALMWSDLFLASGSVINFNNGDVTLTHATDTLTVGGGNVDLGNNLLVNIGAAGTDFTANGGLTLDELLTVNDDVDFVFAAGENLLLNASSTANTTTAGVIDLNVTSLTHDNRGLDVAYTSTAAGAAATVTQYGISSTLTSTQAVTATSPTFTYYANYQTAAKSGADNLTTGGTFNTYGLYATASNTSTDVGAAGTRNTYGGFFDSTGAAGGTTSAFGVYIADVSGADTNVALCFDCDGTWTSSTVASGIQFGTDAAAVTLYRSADNILRTDDTFHATSFYDIDNTAYFLDPAATGTSLTVAGQADIEGYAAIGNGSALSASRTLIIDRAFSVASGDASQLLIGTAGAITATGGSGNLSVLQVQPGGVTINSAGTHAIVASARFLEPNITETSGTVTTATTVYIDNAPTEGDSNYALYVDSGIARFDGRVYLKQAADSFGDAIRLEASGATNTWDIVMGGDAKLYLGYNSVTQALISTDGNLSLGNIAAASRLGLEGTGVTKGITFGDGAANPVTLYRNAADELKTDDSLTVAAQADIEGYAAIGNGSALNSHMTLISDRDFTASGGPGRGIFVAGTITSSAAQRVAYLEVLPDSTPVAAATTASRIATMELAEPNISLGAGSAVTDAVTLYIVNAPTEAATNNYALWVDAGDTRLDGDLLLPNATAATSGLLFGGDAELFRGAANRLDLASGDSLNVVDGNIVAAGTTSYLGIGGGTGSGVIDARATVQDTGVDIPGMRWSVVFPSTATTQMTGVLVNPSTAAATYTTTTYKGVQISNVSKGANHTITTNYGLYIASQTAGGTNNYGLYIQGASGGATTNYALWVDDGTVQFDSTLSVDGTTTLSANVTLDGTAQFDINPAITNISNTNNFAHRVRGTYTVTAANSGTGYAGYGLVALDSEALSGAFTTTEASTLLIEGAPTAAGGGAITRAYALYVVAGNTKLAGNVGIGTTSPKGVLDLDTEGYALTPGTSSDNLVIQGNSPGMSILTNDGGQARLVFGEQADTTKAMIAFFSGGTDRLVFSGGDDSTEHMTIDGNGQVDIPTNGSTGGIVLGSETQIYRSAVSTLTVPKFNWTDDTGDTNTTRCRNAAGNLASCTSLAKWKDNVQTLSLGLDTVLTLHPVSFDWNSLKSSPETVKHDLGFIAEEVAAVDPLLASYNRDTGELEGVRYAQMTSLLVKAIQELNSKVDAIMAAGIINAQQITTNGLQVATENFTIAGQNIRDYISAVVQDIISQSTIVNSQSLVSPLASIDQIHTNLISPLASSSAIAIRFDNSQLSIVNGQSSTSSAIASIDNTGNATFSGTLNIQQLTTNKVSSDELAVSSATISGTLRAERIVANQIEGQYVLSASESAALAYVSNLMAETATFNQGIIALGPSSLMDTSIVGQLSINSSLILADNSINVLGADLEIQPFRQGGISFLSGLVRIDSEGNLNVGGNATFEKDVAVKGKLAANIISPLPDQDLVFNLPSSDIHNSSFIIRNSTGSAVFAVNNLGDLIASGAATVNKLKFNFAAPALALSATEALATSSAGVATISAQQIELTITNPLVTQNSLIYITPVGSPNGQTPYLIRQVPNGSFTAGIQLPSGLDTTFNWLIVN